MDVCDNFGDAADVAADDEDLNKNHDKIWETVKALNNVRNNTGYKDACKATAYPAFVLYSTECFAADFSLLTPGVFVVDSFVTPESFVDSS